VALVEAPVTLDGDPATVGLVQEMLAVLMARFRSEV
jgi:hypothetical protein